MQHWWPGAAAGTRGGRGDHIVDGDRSASDAGNNGNNNVEEGIAQRGEGTERLVEDHITRLTGGEVGRRGEERRGEERRGEEERGSVERGSSQRPPRLAAGRPTETKEHFSGNVFTHTRTRTQLIIERHVTWQHEESRVRNSIDF
jgi:hypothetical protein